MIHHFDQINQLPIITIIIIKITIIIIITVVIIGDAIGLSV